MALVTGGNRGIGREVCRQLAGQGLRVVLTGRNAGSAEAAAAELRGQGFDVVPAVMDVADVHSVLACAADVVDRVGNVDVLVNNAAVLIAEHDDLLDTSRDAFIQTFETNVWGVLATCQSFVH